MLVIELMATLQGSQVVTFTAGSFFLTITFMKFTMCVEEIVFEKGMRDPQDMTIFWMLCVSLCENLFLL